MKTQIEKLDRLIREIEMDEYLNEETLPKIREAKGLVNTLHEQCGIVNVSKQRELLENFADWMDENVNFDGIMPSEINSYLEEIKER